MLGLLLLFIVGLTGCEEETGDNGLQKDEIAYKEAPKDYVSQPLILDEMDDAVAIHYSTWFNPVHREGGLTYDISKILEQARRTGKDPEWGPLHAFHYWGQPALGYYRSDQADVIRTHMKQLYTAQIDFIILDHTNASSGWKNGVYIDEIFHDPVKVLLDTMLDMRRSGEPTPHVVIWAGSSPNDPEPQWAGMDVYERLYKDGRYDELFVKYEDKPLLLTTDMQPEPLKEHFTLRKMWGLQGTLQEKEWSFLQEYPQNIAMNSGKPEQMVVLSAMQRGYMSENNAIPKRGGRTFAEQWQRAFEVRPKIVTVTWWNEWIAQRFEDENGKTRFVDAYSPEYSRDIEPMQGGYGDQYYRWLIAYVTAYKNREPFPQGLIELPYAMNEGLLDIGSFETGTDGWKPGKGTEKLALAAVDDEDAPRPAEGRGLLAVHATGKTSRIEHVLAAPSDWRAFDELEASIFVDEETKQPGKAVLNLTFADGTQDEHTFPLTKGRNYVSFEWPNGPAYEKVERIDIAWNRSEGGKAVWYADEVRVRSSNSLNIEPVRVVLDQAGESAQLSPETSPKGAASDLTSQISYESADPNIATVDKSGRVTAVAPGETTITARYGYKTDLVPVAVRQMISLTVTPTEATLVLNALDAHLNVQAEISDGTVQDVTNDPRTSYSSGDDSIVTVNDDGTLRAISPGKTDITASYLGLTSKMSVQIVEAGDILLLGSFEAGTDAWVAGDYVTQALATVSAAAEHVPEAYEGKGLLEIQLGAFDGSLWKSTVRSFDSPLDLTAYSKLAYSINGWGGAPGATGYKARIRLTAADGTVWERENEMSGGWNAYTVELGEWPKRSQVVKLDIGFQAVDGKGEWAGKYYIDGVNALR